MYLRGLSSIQEINVFLSSPRPHTTQQRGRLPPSAQHLDAATADQIPHLRDIPSRRLGTTWQKQKETLQIHKLERLWTFFLRSSILLSSVLTWKSCVNEFPMASDWSIDALPSFTRVHGSLWLRSLTVEISCRSFEVSFSEILWNPMKAYDLEHLPGHWNHGLTHAPSQKYPNLHKIRDINVSYW